MRPLSARPCRAANCDARLSRLFWTADARLDDVGQPHLDLGDPYGIRGAGRVELMVCVGLKRRRRHADDLLATEDSEAHAQAGQVGRGAQIADRDEELRLAVVHVRSPAASAGSSRTVSSDVGYRPPATARAAGRTGSSPSEMAPSGGAMGAAAQR